MNIGTSPLTGKIYAGRSKPLKNGKGFYWVGKKTDVTDEAIRAVYEWFIHSCEESDEESDGYEISFPGVGTLTYLKETALAKQKENK